MGSQREGVEEYPTQEIKYHGIVYRFRAKKVDTVYHYEEPWYTLWEVGKDKYRIEGHKEGYISDVLDGVGVVRASNGKLADSLPETPVVDLDNTISVVTPGGTIQYGH